MTNETGLIFSKNIVTFYFNKLFSIHFWSYNNIVLRSGLNNNQVGIFYSYQPFWVALVRPPSGGYCYLNHACIVIYLCPHWVKWLEIQMKFLDKVYWFWMRNWLCAFLIIKRNFCFWNTLKIFLLNKTFFINQKTWILSKIRMRNMKKLGRKHKHHQWI